MNPILEKWLAEKQAEVSKNRKEFLIEQGLIDPDKTTKVFKDGAGNIISAEEAKTRIRNGLRVDEFGSYVPLDLTDEEYNQVLTYAQPKTLNDGEPTDHELLKRISRRTGVVSTIFILNIILSVIIGIYLGVKLG